MWISFSLGNHGGNFVLADSTVKDKVKESYYRIAALVLKRVYPGMEDGFSIPEFFAAGSVNRCKKSYEYVPADHFRVLQMQNRNSAGKSLAVFTDACWFAVSDGISIRS